MTLAWLLIVLGGLASLVGGFMLVVAAFRVSVGWGLALLFLSWLVVPLVLFLVKFWPEAKRGFLISIGGWVVSAIGWFIVVGSVASTAMAEFDGVQLDRPVTFEPVAADEPSTGVLWDEPAPDPEPDPVPIEPLPTTAPTATAVDEEPAVQAQPQRGDDGVDVIALDEVAGHVGALVSIRLKDGSVARVTIDAVSEQTVTVTQRLGGGAMSYPIRRDTIDEIELLR